MKRILFLTLAVAAAALLSGCVDMDDHGTQHDQDHNDSDHYDHQNFNGGGY
ncbi:MAG TPA: hypothetical protein VNW23_07515 [Opitutaceae bacterium]|nr:hypothetical protein [Opitutaceae bacterium]